MSQLKYLFEAELKDGTVYKQNKDDVSVLYGEPKSCFTDIKEQAEKFEIKKFTLVEQTLLPQKYSVDLTDGHFSICGFSIMSEGEKALPIDNPLFKLIFYRQHRHSVNVTYELKGLKPTSREILPEGEVTYVIGWQTTIQGKNYQQKILIQ